MRARRTLTIAALVLLAGIGYVVLVSGDPHEAKLDRAPGRGDGEEPGAPMLVGSDGGPRVTPATDGGASDNASRGATEAASLRRLQVEVTRSGTPAPRITLEIQGTGASNSAFHKRLLSDDSGRVVASVPPGPYHVSAAPRPGHLVVSPWSKARRLGPFRTPHIARVAIEIAKHADPEPIPLKLSGTTILVRVVEAGTNRVIEGATVVADLSAYTGHFVTGAKEQTDERGEARILDLPLAVFGVNVLAEGYQGSPPKQVTLDTEHREHELAFELVSGGTLIVRLENDAGELQKISAALGVVVTREPAGDGVGRTWPHQTSGKNRPTELRWERIAPGQHGVSIRDQELDSGFRFQPVDPLRHDDVLVRAGETTELTLRVRYRAYVTLAGQDGAGNLDRSLKLTVRAAGQKQVVLPAPWQRGNRHGASHFEGYLAPGTYDLELTRKDGRTWHERLVVEREVLHKTFRAPWRD